MEKTIITAVERGGYCYAYGKNNSVILTQFGKLWGFTSASMSVKRGNYVYTYDVNGRVISTQYCS